jgi:hypothetical protein
MVTGKVIYGILSADTTVKSYVSTRIYPGIAEQGAIVPLITFNNVQRTPTDTKKSVSRLDVYQVEINIFHNNYTTACLIADAVRTALDQKRDVTINSVKVDAITYDNGVEMYAEDANLFIIQETYNMRIHR